MPATVRAAAPADEQRVAEVHTAAWRRAFHNVLPVEYLDSQRLADMHREWWRKRFADNSWTIRVADLDGKVVGFGTFGSAIDGETGAELRSLNVDPTCWSMGVGSALQRDIKAQMTEAGYRSAYLWVVVDSPRAHRSYRKNGWIVTEDTRVEEFDGNKVEEVKLRLEW